MRRVFVALALLLAAAPQAVAGVTTWTSSGPPGAGNVHAVIAAEGTTREYALYEAGTLMRRTSAAAPWVIVGPHEEFANNRLFVDPQNPDSIWMNGDGSLRSTDGGVTVQQTPAPAPIDMAFDRQRHQTIYLVDGSALYTSGNGGRTFAVRNRTQPFQGVTVGLDDPQNVLAATPEGIFRSDDGGRHFRRSTGTVIDPEQGFFPKALAFLPGTRDRIALAATTSGLFRSTDGGRSWSIVAGVSDVWAIAANPRNPSIVLIGTVFDGLRRSTDNGQTFTAVPGTPGARFVSADMEVPGRFLAASAYGALVSVDGGRTFRADNAGVRARNVQLAPAPTSGEVWAIADDTSLVHTTDAGASWTAQPLASLAITITVARPSGAIIIADGIAGGVSRSTDGGATFSPIAGFDGQFVFQLVRGPSDVVWAKTDFAIYRSTDAGATFTAIPEVPGFFSEDLAADAVEPGTAYSVAAGQIYATRDGGTTWTSPGPPVPDVPGINMGSMTPDGAVAGRVWLEMSEPTGGLDEFTLVLYRSDDYASTFVRVAPLVGVSAVSVDSAGTLYTGDLGAINKSVDGGVTWTTLPTAGLPAGGRFFSPPVPDAAPGVLYLQGGRDGVFTLGR